MHLSAANQDVRCPKGGTLLGRQRVFDAPTKLQLGTKSMGWSWGNGTKEGWPRSGWGFIGKDGVVVVFTILERKKAFKGSMDYASSTTKLRIEYPQSATMPPAW